MDMARGTQRTGTSARRGPVSEPAGMDGGMSVREAGRKGGEAVKKKYGPEFYSKIGQIGGEAVAKARGPEFYSQIGKMGGETVKRAHGPEFYSDIGRKGGEAVRSKHGAEYYSQIGKKGGASNSRGRGRAAGTAKRAPSA
jgi:general stress protein YciG